MHLVLSFRFFVRAVVVFALAVLLLAPAGREARAQSGTFFNQRDDAYPLLGLKRAKEAYETSRAEYERQKELFDKQLISRQALENAFRSFSDAEVNYQQSLLSVLFEQQYVVVSRAVKFQGRGGRKRVRLTLKNSTGGTAEFQKLIGIEDELFRSLQPDRIDNIYISLLNDDNAIISQPYEQKIDVLTVGEPVTVDFGLLQDLDAVTVSLLYGNGTQQSRKIFLEKDASVNIAAIQAEQFSQEVDLGGSTDYAMTLELFSGVSNTFKLEVVNLPSEITSYFLDPGTSNRLSQFQFTEGVNTREAALRVFLPERPTGEVNMDEAIPFYAVAIPRERVDEIGTLRDRTLTQSEIEALNVGYVRLELVPRGIGEILVRAPQLFHTIKPDETVDVNVEIVNEGTRRLDNVRIEADLPLNWTDVIEPDVVEKLDINEEQRVQLRFTPPEDIAPGRYEIRIRTTSLSDNQPIEGEDKTVTIEVEQKANVLGTFFLIFVIVGLVVGIVVFGIRLSRR
ncbi:MAG: NEW3 domain-containing protein [Rhodothermales bacterium]